MVIASLALPGSLDIYHLILNARSRNNNITKYTMRELVSALDPRASGLGSSPDQGHCVVFLGKTLNSHSASLHPGV